MVKLNRYIGRTVAGSILLVLLVLLGFDAIAAIIDQTGDFTDQYGFIDALKFVLLSVPGQVFELLPFAALVGCLAGLGVLAGNSELLVMRSAGVTTGRIVWMVMRPALVIMLVGMLNSEYIAPQTQSLAQSERALALRTSNNVVSRHGLWHREGKQFMHFAAVQPNGILYGVNIYGFDEQHRLTEAITAERAIFQGDYWLLEDVSELQLAPEQISQSRQLSKRWQTGLSPALLNILVLEPDDLGIKGLWNYSSYLQEQGLNSDAYRLAFWKKVLQPLSTVALVLVAISFIFGPLREVTMGFRIFIGVLVGVVFNTLQNMLAPASMVFGFPPILASLLPILLCAVAGLYLLRRR